MLKFRPHHFLCTLGFRGHGYSPQFVEAYARIADKLKAPGGDAILIQVEAGTDSVCVVCPNRRETACETEERVRELDRAHSAVLELKPGLELSWGEAKKRIREKMTLDEFHGACSTCSWKASGYCESALRALLKESVKNFAFATVFLLSGLLSGLVLGAPAAHAAEAPGPGAVLSGPIDKLQEDILRQRKAKASRDISAAHAQLKEKHFDAAVKKAKAARKYADYVDYSHWIQATAELALAERELGKKNAAAVGRLVQSAIGGYLEILRQSPYSPLLKGLSEEIARAELLSAEASIVMKSWRAASAAYERAFQRLTEAKKIGTLKPEALAGYAQACAKSKGPLCGAWIQKLNGSFPKSSEEAKTLAKNLSEPLESLKPPRYDRATQAYRAPDRDAVALDAAMEKVHARDFGEAAKLLRSFIDEFPRSSLRWRAQFWLGRSLKEEGDEEDAARIFGELLSRSPLSYYGMLAAIETHQDPESLISATLPVAATSDPFLLPEEAFNLRRAEAFLAEKNPELAGIELRDLRWRPQLSNPFLMYLSVLQHRARNYTVSFSIISELIQRGYEGVATSFMLRLIFPVQYLDLISRYSQDNSLDSVLVLSLVKQESAFDSRALSHAGASGLMQLMPATAVDTVAEILRSELADEEANVRVGTKYLGQLLRRFNGNIVLALAGYNAGPGAVDRWLREPPLKPGMLEFIEGIPYRETREYVSSILRNYFWYSRRIENATKRPMDYFWQVAGPSAVPAAVPAAAPAASEPKTTSQ